MCVQQNVMEGAGKGTVPVLMPTVLVRMNKHKVATLNSVLCGPVGIPGVFALSLVARALNLDAGHAEVCCHSLHSLSSSNILH